MRRLVSAGWLGIGAAMVLATSMAAAPQQEGGDPVWNRVVAMAARSPLTPRAAIVLTTRPGDDRASEIETWVTFHPLPSGDLESTIVYRREGRNVLSTAERERRNEVDTRRRNAAPFRIDEIPLHPQLQPLVRYRRAPAASSDSRFEFTMRRESDEVLGTVEVAAGGKSVQLEFEPRPLPFGVRSFRSTLRLTATAGDGWRLDTMTVAGEVGALWMRRSFRSEYRFLEELPPLPVRR